MELQVLSLYVQRIPNIALCLSLDIARFFYCSRAYVHEYINNPAQSFTFFNRSFFPINCVHIIFPQDLSLTKQNFQKVLLGKREIGSSKRLKLLKFKQTSRYDFHNRFNLYFQIVFLGTNKMKEGFKGGIKSSLSIASLFKIRTEAYKRHAK